MPFEFLVLDSTAPTFVWEVSALLNCSTWRVVHREKPEWITHRVPQAIADCLDTSDIFYPVWDKSCRSLEREVFLHRVAPVATRWITLWLPPTELEGLLAHGIFALLVAVRRCRVVRASGVMQSGQIVEFWPLPRNQIRIHVIAGIDEIKESRIVCELFDGEDPAVLLDALGMKDYRTEHSVGL